MEFLDLAGLQLRITDFIAPVVALFIFLAAGKVVLKFVEALAAMVIFKAKGYRIHDMIEVNGEKAAITKIGLWSTHFMILNGDTQIDFLAVSNERLNFLTVKRHISL